MNGNVLKHRRLHQLAGQGLDIGGKRRWEGKTSKRTLGQSTGWAVPPGMCTSKWLNHNVKLRALHGAISMVQYYNDRGGHGKVRTNAQMSSWRNSLWIKGENEEKTKRRCRQNPKERKNWLVTPTKKRINSLILHLKRVSTPSNFARSLLTLKTGTEERGGTAVGVMTSWLRSLCCRWSGAGCDTGRGYWMLKDSKMMPNHLKENCSPSAWAEKLCWLMDLLAYFVHLLTCFSCTRVPTYPSHFTLGWCHWLKMF